MNFELSDEQDQIRRSVREFAEGELLPNVGEWDETQKVPAGELLKKFAELNLLGVTISEEYGGAGLGYIE
jgi:alkylation response protein AidB-like acyl-CoA dehydrogenase